MIETLSQIKKDLSICKKCGLHKNRTVPVIDDSNINTDIVLVGRDPGANEAIQGKPFVGKAGILLDEMLKSIGLSRKDVFIINTVHCRPDENREPYDDEIAACKTFKDRQLELIKPKVILALGGLAFRELITDKVIRETPISKVRGKWYKSNGIDVLPTFHPAYLLRAKNMKEEAYKDLCLLKDRIKEL